MLMVMSEYQKFVLTAAKVFLGVALCVLVGCGQPGEIRPPGDAAAAKAALQTALDAWIAGQPPGETGSQASVIWTDADWKAGKKLSAYQLVGEPEQNGGNWRIFVDLTLDSGKKPTRVCYAVTLGEPTSILRGDELN
jgi:hypothetical protein